MQTIVRAWSFKADLSLAKMFETLNGGPIRWVEADSDSSEYIGGKLTKPTAARIYENGDHFVVNLRFVHRDGDAAAHFDEAKRILLEEVLPAVGAHDVEICAPFE
jgi:hypothetical protein